METWVTLNIDINKLIDICSNGRKTKEELLETFNIMNGKNVHDTFKYCKFNDNFIDKVACISDGTKIVGTLAPSYTEFLDKIFKILNVNPNLRYLIAADDDNLEEVLKARIEILKTMQNEGALSKEFPMLYDDLRDGRKVINSIRQQLRNLDNISSMTPIERMAAKEDLKKAERQYYKYALSPGFFAKDPKETFIYKQVELYKRFVERRKEYKKLIEKNNYNKYIEKNFDKNKIALLVVNGYLDAMNATNDREKKLKYYNLVKLYLESDSVDRNAEIIVDGKTINFNTITAKAKSAHNKLTRVDIAMNVEFLPAGSGYDVVNGSENTGNRTHMTEEEIANLIEVGRAIDEYYTNSNYSAKVIGLKKFAGYFAYIYPNGIVVLDKDFREKYPSTAEGAIYVMAARDFELLCGIGKTDLIKHPFLIGHRYHRGDWQSKIDEYINKEGTEIEQEESKQLIKRLQDQNKKNI